MTASNQDPRVLLLVPGMSDAPCAALGSRTPLQTARTPALDECARRGWFGTAPIARRDPGRRSMVGLPALLRYESPGPLGRAALEARGLGIAPPPGSLVLRLDFVSTFRGTIADPRAGQLGDGEAELLLETLRRIETPFPLRLMRGFSYRHLAVIEGAAGWELSTVPPHEIVGQPWSDFEPYGRDAAPLVRFQRDAAAALADHVVNRVRLDLGENPADAIWLWGEGAEGTLDPVHERLGVRVALVSAVPLLRGFAERTGMTCPPSRERNPENEPVLRRRCALALSLAADHPLVILHVSGALECSRSRDAVAKVRALEAIDRAVVGPLLRWVGQDPARRLLVASDYPAHVSGEAFPDGPLPFALVTSAGPASGARAFDEAQAASAVALDRLEPLLRRFHDGAPE